MANGAGGGGLVLIGGERPRMRKAGKRDWSKAKEVAFLNVLAETCNVTQACRESQVSMTAAYRRRKMDAAFRSGWVEALAAAYQRLELVLLERAFNGMEKMITRKDGSQERMVEYSNQLGLALLKMHRDTAMEADSQCSPEDIEELRERVIGKLQRLKRRFAQEEAEGE